MNDEELIKLLESPENGYMNCKRIPGRGMCGLLPFIFTVGLCYGLDATGREGRFCYPNYMEARVALELWDGSSNPHGAWIKHKGYSGEFTKQEIEEFLSNQNAG